MKKLILSALMLLSCEAIFAEGTDMYLFWMIGTDAKYDGVSKTVDDLSGYTARLSNGSDYLDLYYDVGGSNLGKKLTVSEVIGLDTIAHIASDPSSMSFFVELLNGDELAYRSDPVSYGALSAYISSMQGQATPADTYAFTTFKAVPEPTSGLLLLLGIAGLALKRKRA